MAARPDPSVVRILDLRDLAAGSLDALLAEEVAAWRRELRWDYSASAALVKRFADMQSLGGFALIHEGEVIGFSYTVAEEAKGLVGDLYVSERYASVELENRLLAASVDSLARQSGIRRIESQILLLAHPRRMPAAYADRLEQFERRFMTRDLAGFRGFAAGPADGRLDLDTWHDRYLEDAARVIADAYDGHVDSRINDQYRSLSGARRFLHNIVQYPGCGTFDASCSWLAWRRDTGRLVGLCLTSRVAPEVGHITQVCVGAAARGQGVGFALIGRSLQSMSEAGCASCSLTVTGANRGAIHLYERMGFDTRRQFAAMVWDHLQAPRRTLFG